MASFPATDIDLNGRHYLGTQEGEAMRRDNRNVINIVDGTVLAEAKEFCFTQPMVRALSLDHFNRQVRVQYTYLTNLAPPVPPAQAAPLAFFQALVVDSGLVSDAFAPADHYVDYTETIRLNVHDTGVIVAAFDPNIDALITANLPAATKGYLISHFVDLVCIVAFAFRVRGHHYLNDMQALYTRVWTKCRYAVADIPFTFEQLATIGTHAIFPIVLDRFWQIAVERYACNGALAKRLDAAAAGTAGPVVLSQGIQDLSMVAPGIRTALLEASEYVERAIEAINQRRFNGSINARYYGSQRIAFDEKRVGSIAATIKAALDQLADDAPLAQSPALARIASNAPITGAVLGRAIARLPDMPGTMAAIAPP